MSEGWPTRYPDVDAIVRSFTEGVVSTLQENLVGVYLTGSLSYEAFAYDSSDIDITVVMEPRPWYWGGDSMLYPEAPFGNEWIINNYHLYNDSLPLVGPGFRELAEPVDIEEVRKACVRDLFQEWVPKKSNMAWFRDSHHESYLVVNLCRILHTVLCSSAGSKETAAIWAAEYCGERWRRLICSARRWHYGVDLSIRDEALDFLDFVVSEVSKTAVYAQVQAEVDPS